MPEFGMDVQEMPYHNQVFKVKDIPLLLEKYIEVQYWGEVEDLIQLVGYVAD